MVPVRFADRPPDGVERGRGWQQIDPRAISMTERIDERLSHVLWIGGSTDSGKTSIARVLSEKHRLPVYHYDQADLRHHIRLAQTSPGYAAFLNSSMDER
jgi:hypothetical protein